MYEEDPGEVFRKAMPETPPPPSQLDLDQIVSDGYKVRRRNRAVLGAATSAGVIAVAGALALSVGVFPTGTADPNDADPSGAPGDATVEDPSMAGYPYAPEDQFGSDQERGRLHEAAMEVFGPLLDEVGVVMTDDVPLEFTNRQSPGNYGQTWLRSYTTGASNDEGDEEEDVVFRLEALLPGGWTAEPGPITEQVFPQHLISASGDPWYTDADWTDELVTTELDDGRQLITVDHECAYEVAVVYPDGSGLRGSWDMGCHEPTSEYEIALEDFSAAALAMPEIDYDTSELAPVGELIEVPTGWIYDTEWEESDEAETFAEDTIESAAAALEELYPDSMIEGADALQLGLSERGAVGIRSYSGSGSLPIETTIDTTTGDVGFDLRYYLPGGWIPGYSETGERGPYLATCQEGHVCTETTDDDGTHWVFEEYEMHHEPTEDEGGGEPFTEHQLEVTRFSPEGWAVSVWLQWTDDAPIDADMLGDILRALPAPEYDEEAVPQIPAE